MLLNLERTDKNLEKIERIEKLLGKPEAEKKIAAEKLLTSIEEQCKNSVDPSPYRDLFKLLDYFNDNLYGIKNVNSVANCCRTLYSQLIDLSRRSISNAWEELNIRLISFLKEWQHPVGFLYAAKHHEYLARKSSSFFEPSLSLEKIKLKANTWKFILCDEKIYFIYVFPNEEKICEDLTSFTLSELENFINEKIVFTKKKKISTKETKNQGGEKEDKEIAETKNKILEELKKLRLIPYESVDKDQLNSNFNKLDPNFNIDQLFKNLEILFQTCSDDYFFQDKNGNKSYLTECQKEAVTMITGWKIFITSPHPLDEIFYHMRLLFHPHLDTFYDDKKSNTPLIENTSLIKLRDISELIKLRDISDQQWETAFKKRTQIIEANADCKYIYEKINALFYDTQDQKKEAEKPRYRLLAYCNRVHESYKNLIKIFEPALVFYKALNINPKKLPQKAMDFLKEVSLGSTTSEQHWRSIKYIFKCTLSSLCKENTDKYRYSLEKIKKAPILQLNDLQVDFKKYFSEHTEEFADHQKMIDARNGEIGLFLSIQKIFDKLTKITEHISSKQKSDGPDFTAFFKKLADLLSDEEKNLHLSPIDCRYEARIKNYGTAIDTIIDTVEKENFLSWEVYDLMISRIYDRTPFQPKLFDLIFKTETDRHKQLVKEITDKMVAMEKCTEETIFKKTMSELREEILTYTESNTDLSKKIYGISKKIEAIKQALYILNPAPEYLPETRKKFQEGVCAENLFNIFHTISNQKEQLKNANKTIEEYLSSANQPLSQSIKTFQTIITDHYHSQANNLRKVEWYISITLSFADLLLALDDPHNYNLEETRTEISKYAPTKGLIDRIIALDEFSRVNKCLDVFYLQLKSYPNRKRIDIKRTLQEIYLTNPSTETIKLLTVLSRKVMSETGEKKANFKKKLCLLDQIANKIQNQENTEKNIEQHGKLADSLICASEKKFMEEVENFVSEGKKDPTYPKSKLLLSFLFTSLSIISSAIAIALAVVSIFILWKYAIITLALTGIFAAITVGLFLSDFKRTNNAIFHTLVQKINLKLDTPIVFPTQTLNNYPKQIKNYHGKTSCQDQSEEPTTIELDL